MDYHKTYKNTKVAVDKIKALEIECARLASLLPATPEDLSAQSLFGAIDTITEDYENRLKQHSFDSAQNKPLAAEIKELHSHIEKLQDRLLKEILK